MRRLEHWFRHNNYLIMTTIMCEIIMFPYRAGMWCKPEGDGYAAFWGPLSLYRIWQALRCTFPVPTSGWGDGEIPCTLESEHCLYRVKEMVK